MPKVYYFSPGLSECAGCGAKVDKDKKFGAAILNTAEPQQMYYVLCANCAPRRTAEDAVFVHALDRTLIARAEELGAFVLENAGTPENERGAK